MITNTDDFWESKLSALLHDPITKAFAIKDHEKLASDIKKTLIILDERGAEDSIASAMDRFPLPYDLKKINQIRIGFDELKLVHPFSGEDLSKLKEKLNPTNNEFLANVEELKKLNDTNEKFYHALWWNLPFLVKGAQFLPADTRIPNHPIIDHLDITAALKACVEGKKVEASLVAISIGPVQEIIAQARKTVDLWAGSYLLSYLIYQAVEVVGLKWGFDMIIYPYLRGVSFVKKTLESIGVKLRDYYPIQYTSSKVAALPNVFVSIVPASEVDEIERECKSAILKSWEEFSSNAKDIFKSMPPQKYNPSSFEKQLKTFPIINSVSIPLIEPDQAVATINKYFMDSGIDEYEMALKVIKDFGGYNPNVGSYYRYSYRLLMSKFAAIKGIRYFPGFSDSSNVGKYYHADDFGYGTRACVVFEDPDGKKDILGAVNAIKRVLPDILKKMKYLSTEKEIKYLSTSDIALKNSANAKLLEAIEKGELIKEEAYRRLKNSYLAVLMMDGDQMGKWVSGDNAPEYEKLLHPKVKEVFESEPDLKNAWNTLKRLKSIQPAYHRGLSRTLGVFSMLVEKVVESHKGMLVYCGGDDVLALLPADTVLKCANDLRKLYSGLDVEIQVSGKKYKAENGILSVDNIPIAPLMGQRATMSAGIAVVHHKFPLQVALQMAREAEHYAKENLGRNAFVIMAVRRSGQITRVGSKWDFKNELMDVPSFAFKILEDMEKLKVSHRSLYKLLSEDLPLFENKLIYKLVDYVIERSTATKDENEKRKYKENLKKFVDALYRFYRGLNADNVDALRIPIDLLLTIRFMERGEKE